MSNENIILPAMSDQMTEAELLTWKVSTGDEVKKGEVIAQIGNSEAAYPMLRFQLRKNGKPMMNDKLDFLL